MQIRASVEETKIAKKYYTKPNLCVLCDTLGSFAVKKKLPDSFTGLAQR